MKINHNTDADWIARRERKHLVFLTSFYVIGVLCFVIAATDLFSESFFKRKYAVFYISFFSATLFISKVFINYFRQKKLR